MTGMGSTWDQENRSVRNLLNHGLAVKDHKILSLGDTPPTRSVMGGNVGDNKPLSEFMSLILEPVAKRMESMEANSTSGFLNIIESLNADLSNQKKQDDSMIRSQVDEASSQEEEFQGDTINEGGLEMTTNSGTDDDQIPTRRKILD